MLSNAFCIKRNIADHRTLNVKLNGEGNEESSCVKLNAALIRNLQLQHRQITAHPIIIFAMQTLQSYIWIILLM